MSNSSLNIDPRIIPLVRSLKEQNNKLSDPLSKKGNNDISSEKTSENSTKTKKNIDTKNKNKNENEKNKNEEKEKPKKHNSVKRFNNKANTMTKKSINTKISIDGSLESKKKSGTSGEQRGPSQSDNKIKIFSKQKEPKESKEQHPIISPANTFQITRGQLKTKKYNNMKTRSKYVQNLLNDMSIKKYKNSCIDILKNDNVVKKLYEQCGFEKTNYSYESFIQNNFFNNPLFMYKLEMLFLDESNFVKKNFKENFFKNEIIKYLNQCNNEDIYLKQIASLKNVFKEGFEDILNFDLFHE
jgi:hypothetical protein